MKHNFSRRRTLHDWTRLFLVVAIVGITVFITNALLGGTVAEAGKDVLLVVVGVVVARFGSVYDFYFGSSSGSKEKTDALATPAASPRVDPVE